MNIAIIPARGGSKRIANKNIKDFCGKPIIAYAIACARGCGAFERVVVSTDSEAIARVARGFGAEVLALREAKFSDDYATTLDVMSYEVARLGLDSHDIVCCLYATTPLLAQETLRAALENIPQNAYTFAACAFSANPLRGFFIKNHKIHLLSHAFGGAFGGALAESLGGDLTLARSQDLECVYYDAGQFYVGFAGVWAARRSIFAEDSRPFVLDEMRVSDINTPQDWAIAEIKYKILCAQ